MKIVPLDIPEVLRLEPRVFSDDRGYFLESYSTRAFPGDVTFVQDNFSFSCRNTLRGLHLQEPGAQGKLVMAVMGTIWDVAVDVRVGSPTFGKWVAAELSSETKHQLYIPPGFAHGFCVTSENALVHYKCTSLYAPDCEVGVLFSDPEIDIPWPTERPLLSQKDAAAPCLSEIAESKLPRFGDE